MFNTTKSARNLLLTRWDEALKDTRLVVHEAGQSRIFGRKDEAEEVETVDLRVHNPRFFGRTVSLGSLGLGEAYMDGDFDVDGGVERLYLALARNRLNFKRRTDPVFALQYFSVLAANRLAPRLRNIDTHYSLGDELYEEAFLDPLMLYTCGYAETKDDDLDTLQRNKMDRVCRKLELKPGERLLDLGCGWGGFLIYAAREHGVTGVGMNLNRDQVASANRRIADAGLSDRIEVRWGPYDGAEGTYDKVSTIGMIEHLHRGEYVKLCRSIDRYLRPGGLAIIHGIGNSGVKNKHDPFVQKYLFPDSNQPLLSELSRACEKAGLAILDVENYIRSYYLTMLRWGENFEANRHRLDPVRYDQRFVRMWQIYIAWGLAAARYSSGANFEMLVTNDHMRDHPLGRV